MTGEICTRLRTSLVLLGFLALMQGLPRCKSEKQCYQLRLDRPDHNYPCEPKFLDDAGCNDILLDTIKITNATVTVNALLDPDDSSSEFTETVDATDAANSFVRCDTFSCRSLAFILLANYSTQYCLGVTPNPGLASVAQDGIIYIDADVHVNYTNTETAGYFKASFRGNFWGKQYFDPSSGNCWLFKKISVSQNFSASSSNVLTTMTCPNVDPLLESTTDSSVMATGTSHAATLQQTTPNPTTQSLPQPVSSSESPSAPEITTALAPTHDLTTPSSTPETSTAQPSTVGVNTPSTPTPTHRATPTPGTTPSLSPTHGNTQLQSSFTEVAAILSSTHITVPPLASSSLATLGVNTTLAPIPKTTPSPSHVATAQQPSTQSCGNLVSEEISEDELGGNQQCGSTFTFHFSSLNVTNVTVRYAYIPRYEISGNADDVQLASNDQEGSVVRVISTVIEINLLDGNTTIRLSDGSVDIIFKIDSTEDFPPNNDSSVVHCAYMVNESTWSTEGLRAVSVNSDSVVCHSSHLTSFAVLLSVKSPEGIHAKVQSYMSYLLGAISIASLTLAVLIYFVTGTYKILKIQIHMNLAIATALGQLLFLTMAESTWNRAICKGVAVTLHYLFTATLAWTMIEGVFLYRTTAVGFKPLKIGWLSLIAWGSSLVVVGVSFGIKFDTYGQSNYCWLYAEDYTIYIFAACVFGTELFSFVVLWFVMRVFNSLKANKNKDGIDKFKATARALFIILPIIGLTWLAGTITSISASDDVIPFQYIFIITFSLQGVCILVFHCLMVPDVKTAIKLRMNRRVTDKSWANSKSTKSTASSTL